jgi:hypothetical protein
MNSQWRRLQQWGGVESSPPPCYATTQPKRSNIFKPIGDHPPNQPTKQPAPRPTNKPTDRPTDQSTLVPWYQGWLNQIRRWLYRLETTFNTGAKQRLVPRCSWCNKQNDIRRTQFVGMAAASERKHEIFADALSHSRKRTRTVHNLQVRFAKFVR